MFCTKCGTKNNDDANFCVNCGEPLAKPASQAAAAVREDASQVLAQAQQAVDAMNATVIENKTEVKVPELSLEENLDSILGRANQVADSVISEPVKAEQPAAPVFTGSYASTQTASTGAEVKQNTAGTYYSAPQQTYEPTHAQAQAAAAYGSNSPYAPENTQKLEKQTKKTTLYLIIGIAAVAVIVLVLFLTGVLGGGTGKKYTTYEALVNDYISMLESGSFNTSKLYAMYNDQVHKDMTKAYEWPSDNEEFMLYSDAILYMHESYDVAIPGSWSISDTYSYDDMLSQLIELNNASGDNIDYKECIRVEIDADTSKWTDDQYYYYDDYYLLTLYRTNDGWYLLFVD